MRSNGRDEDGRTAFGKGTWEVANASFVGSNDRGCFGDTEDMAKIGNLVMWMITIVIYIYIYS